MRRKKTAQDAPGTIFSRGVAIWYPPFEHVRAQRHVSCLTVLGTFRTGEDGVDAAVPMDAKNAPTATCKTAKNAVSHKRPHRLSFSGKEETEEGTTTPKLQVCQSRLSQQRGSPQDRVLERGRFLTLDGPSMRTKHLGLDDPTAPEASDPPARLPDRQVIRISGIDAPEFPEPTEHSVARSRTECSGAKFRSFCAVSFANW